MSGKVYAPWDWWVRWGRLGPGLSVQPAAHTHRLPGSNVAVAYVPFSEREGLQRAWHVLGLCIKPLRRVRGEGDG